MAPPRLGEPARPLAVGATISTAAALGCAPRAASGRWRRSSRGGIPCQLWEGGERRRPLETRHGRAAIGTTTGSGQRPATPSTATARARVLPAEPRGRRRPLPPLALPAARRRDLHPRASVERVCGGADGRSRPRELALAQDPAHPHRRRPRSVSSLHARVRQAIPERLRQLGHHCHHWSCHQLSQGWAQRTAPPHPPHHAQARTRTRSGRWAPPPASTRLPPRRRTRPSRTHRSGTRSPASRSGAARCTTAAARWARSSRRSGAAATQIRAGRRCTTTTRRYLALPTQPAPPPPSPALAASRTADTTRRALLWRQATRRSTSPSRSRGTFTSTCSSPWAASSSSRARCTPCCTVGRARAARPSPLHRRGALPAITLAPLPDRRRGGSARGLARQHAQHVRGVPRDDVDGLRARRRAETKSNASRAHACVFNARDPGHAKKLFQY